MPADNHSVTLGFIGDVYIGDDHPLLTGEVIERLRQCDAVIANFESPICIPSPIDTPVMLKSTGDLKTILLRSEPGCEKLLREWGIRYVTLANNHIFDHGELGFIETVKRLEQQGIEYTGAGLCLSKASKPMVINIGGVRIAILAGTEERAQSFLAGEQQSGCNNLDAPSMCKQIRTIKTDVDHVVVAAHWGYCQDTLPPEDVITTANSFLEAGASVIIGHHSHTIHGFQQPNQASGIAYSLGNFYFAPYYFKSRLMEAEKEEAQGAILLTTFHSDGRCEFKWVFTCQRKNTVAIDSDPNRVQQLKARSLPVANAFSHRAFVRKVARDQLLRRLRPWGNPRNWLHFRVRKLSNLRVALREAFVSGVRRIYHDFK